MHSLTLKEENNLIKNLSQSEKLEYIFIETRTIYDELYGVGRKMKKNEFFLIITTIYRSVEIKKLSKNFKIIYYQCKKLCKIQNENPKVLRIICKNDR